MAREEAASPKSSQFLSLKEQPQRWIIASSSQSFVVSLSCLFLDICLFYQELSPKSNFESIQSFVFSAAIVLVHIFGIELAFSQFDACRAFFYSRRILETFQEKIESVIDNGSAMLRCCSGSNNG